MDYLFQAEGIPQYINKIEAAQAWAKRANLPISKKSLVAIVNLAMLGIDKYVDETKL